MAASDTQVDRVTLTGLTSISVVVEGLPSIARNSGLRDAALQADVERRLRQAGISLTSDADAYPYVHVTVADPGGLRTTVSDRVAQFVDQFIRAYQSVNPK